MAAGLLSGVPTLGGDLRTAAGFRKAKTSLLGLIPRTFHAVSRGFSQWGSSRGWGRTCRRQAQRWTDWTCCDLQPLTSGKSASPLPRSSGEATENASAEYNMWAKNLVAATSSRSFLEKTKQHTQLDLKTNQIHTVQTALTCPAGGTTGRDGWLTRAQGSWLPPSRDPHPCRQGVASCILPPSSVQGSFHCRVLEHPQKHPHN